MCVSLIQAYLNNKNVMPSQATEHQQGGLSQQFWPKSNADIETIYKLYLDTNRQKHELNPQTSVEFKNLELITWNRLLPNRKFFVVRYGQVSI